MRRMIIASAAIAFWPGVGLAHDFWSNGEAVPPWVKASCCGPADEHHFRASAVHISADGYHIDGLDVVIPMSRALPSPDGEAWGFWSSAAEPNTLIYCFFFPLNGA